MTQFAAEIQQEGALQVVSLIDQKNSVKAKIIPELGNNLVSLAVFNLGANTELISIPTDLQNLKNKVYQFYGNPILFPFPGRIPKGEFHYQDQKFQVSVNFRDGTAIHGFVYDKKWEISEISTPSSKEAFLKSTYTSDSTLEKFFPFPFQIEMTYILRESELELVFKSINRGKQALPFGYGIHPYFTLPGKREDWTLYLPAAEIYELINILPTGVSKKIPKQLDFRAEKSLQGIYMDDLFGKLKKNKQGFVT
jgi:aldose 1-epimerase